MEFSNFEEGILPLAGLALRSWARRVRRDGPTWAQTTTHKLNLFSVRRKITARYAHNLHRCHDIGLKKMPV